MKINVVKDASGKVVATFGVVSGNGPQMEPVLSKGHHVEQTEVPETFQSDLSGLYK